MRCHAPAEPKLPPEPWPEHSIMWPIVSPCAKRFRPASSFGVKSQPNSCTSGARNSAASATRPVSTMSAPAASACTIGAAPR